MLYKRKLSKGFTITEVLISSSIMIIILASITSFYYAFNKTSIYRSARMELNASLRNIVERLNRELASSVGVVRQSSLKLNNIDFYNGSSPSQAVIEVLAYDTSGNPMFNIDGKLKRDRIGIKAIPVTPEQIIRRDNNVYKLHKITFTIEPTSPNPGIDNILGTSDDIKSARQAISNQILFNSLMPVTVPSDPSTVSGGTYNPPLKSEYTNTQKLFTYYKTDPDTSNKVEVTNIATEYDDISSIKINLIAEKQVPGRSALARQETEIIFRNFQ